MTLLRLSPDSERLRRIAKAHAAGELSTPDYRRIRAEVIAGFTESGLDAPGDETEPRWLYRPIAPSIKTDAPASRRANGGPTPFWTWAFVVGLVIMVVVVAVAAHGSAGTDAQRDPSAVPESVAVVQLAQSLQTTL